MTLNITLVVVGSALVSTTVAYLCWTQLRIVLLRQRLFDIRDALWDRARELRGFENPAYREARYRLNNAIRAVHWLTLPNMIRVPGGSEVTYLKSDDPRLQEAIDNAYAVSAKCIQHHIMRHTLCGLFVATVACFYAIWARKHAPPIHKMAELFKRRVGRPLVSSAVESWIRSPSLAEFARAEELSESNVSRDQDLVLSGS